tara:strand:+ start:129 stop:470 length:342 start_codon:yes stop_codon:yes gene_type:complete
MTNQDQLLNITKQLYENKTEEPVLCLGDGKDYEEAKQIFGKSVQSLLQFIHKSFLFKETDYNSQNIQSFESINYLRPKYRFLKMIDRIDLNLTLGCLYIEVYFNNIIVWKLKK